MRVKNLVLYIALLLTASFLLVGKHRPIQPQITPERIATHMITYYTPDSDRPEALCTGTAVGPHALLTALHCDRGEIDTISLDLSVKKFHIIDTAYDGRDHIIYHLDGPAFTHYVTIKQREAVLGETITSYGDGHQDFPQHTYYGTVITDDNGGDTSENDKADGVHVFSIPVVPGDSGSAVYGRDGDIVALVTYGGINDEGQNNAVGFALNFKPEVLEEIKQLGETQNVRCIFEMDRSSRKATARSSGRGCALVRHK